MSSAKEAVAGKAHDIKEAVGEKAQHAKDTISGKASEAKVRLVSFVILCCCSHAEQETASEKASDAQGYASQKAHEVGDKTREATRES